jgi:integrase
MARPVTQARLEGRRLRLKLKPGRQAHWQTITPNRAHLGYQRWPDDKAGRWILRRYAPGSGYGYSVLPLGQADDVAEADGRLVLSYEQAFAAAVAAADTNTKIHLLTVRKAMERYIEFKQAQGQSVTDLVSRASAHIIPVLGDAVVSELSAEQLRRWLATLAASPKMKRTGQDARQQYGAEPVTDDDVRRRRASANRVLTYLKAALNHCFDEGHVPSNDAWGRKLKPFRDVEVARVRYLTVAEAKRLINASDPEFRPLVEAALQTGARYSELVRLEVADFNPDAGTVTIRKSKSGKARHIVLTDEGVAFFRQVCAGRSGSDRMFQRHGLPWKASQQARPIFDACQRAKISPPVGFHQLRHTYASHCVMNGVPLLIVGKNLGHSDVRMCEKHYAHMAPDHVAEAIKAGAPKFGIKPQEKIVPLR